MQNDELVMLQGVLSRYSNPDPGFEMRSVPEEPVAKSGRIRIRIRYQKCIITNTEEHIIASASNLK